MSDALLKRAKRFFYADVLDGLERDSDFELLGSDNLRYLVRYLRAKETELSRELGEFKDFQRLLGSGPAALLAMQGPKGSGHVTWTERALPGGGVEVVPTDATLEQLATGDTTLRLCGWCKFQGSGSYRGAAMLSGHCTLLKEVEKQASEVQCSTPCRLATLHAEGLRTLAQGAGARADTRKAMRDELRTVIAALRAIEYRCASRPMFAGWREADHFGLGEKVVVWLRPLPRLTTRVPFITARRESGFRQHDGLVHLRTDKPVTSDEYREGCGITAGVHMPHIVSVTEFWALRTASQSMNADERRFFELWVGNAAQTLGFNSHQYEKDMREGMLAGA